MGYSPISFKKVYGSLRTRDLDRIGVNGERGFIRAGDADRTAGSRAWLLGIVHIRKR